MANETQNQNNPNLHPVRLIVAGSRPPKGIDIKVAKSMLDEYRTLIFNHLDNLLSNTNPSDVAIISGMAAGADMIGYEYANKRGLHIIEMPADWEMHKKRAGYLRNEEMAKRATHAAIYHDGFSKGAAHMIEVAKSHNLVLRVENKATPALFARFMQVPAPAAEVLPVAAPAAEELPEEGVEEPDKALQHAQEAAATVEAHSEINNAAVEVKTEPAIEIEADAKLDAVEPKPETEPKPVNNKSEPVKKDVPKVAEPTNLAIEAPKPEPMTAKITPFEPVVASVEMIAAAASEPGRYRLLEQMQDIVLEVQEGVAQAANSIELPVQLFGTVGDEIPVVMLDLETTGFDASCEEIIEVGLIRCMASPSTGKITRIERACSLLEQPSKALSDVIVKVTGITDEVLEGHTIDDAQVASYFDDAPFVIAHNASFDRPFFESRFPSLQGMNWLCTIKQAPWQEKGFESNKLEYLALKTGFFYAGHRAATDALAIVELLNRHTDVFPYMLESHDLLPVTFRAVRAPFSAKDDLKAAGFRWDDGANSGVKAWYFETAIHKDKVEAAVEEHRQWMVGLYGAPAKQCDVTISKPWQRYMSKDTAKLCESEFKGVAKEEVKGNEPTP